ncbi:hypothetical protein NM688_g3153 [Phlebia brevispora]|uniref:Uncharacterized protein n=1 Tax=Phlebia brevispora TaxID=194682 RepID=A0ACC1T6S1_9APHY|nr:hypothetical protein NM688_g3153 [Phlebia brevispora]
MEEGPGPDRRRHAHPAKVHFRKIFGILGWRVLLQSLMRRRNCSNAKFRMSIGHSSTCTGGCRSVGGQKIKESPAGSVPAKTLSPQKRQGAERDGSLIQARFALHYVDKAEWKPGRTFHNAVGTSEKTSTSCASLTYLNLISREHGIPQRNANVYTPYESQDPALVIDDSGVQSSEEGSDLHSPTFEVPVPQDVRYHLGHRPTDVGVATSLVPPHFDARFPPQHLDVQISDPHLLETLQVPGANSYHIPPPQSQIDFDLHHHPVFDLSVEPPHLPHPALSPGTEYSFNLPQSRYSEQQLRISYEPPPAPSRSSFAMAPNETSEQQPRTSPSASGSASGSNPTSGPTRPPRREASNQVIACRQCRARKIRCDSTRPTCHNCTRRGNECEYDAVPKRRGPDKRPGTRQRSCKKRPSEAEASTSVAKKKRKTEGDGDGSLIAFDVRQGIASNEPTALLSPPPVPSNPDEGSALLLARSPALVLDTSHTVQSEIIYPKQIESSSLVPPRFYSMDSPINRSFRRTPYDDNRQELSLSPSSTYPTLPWWDKLLTTYAATPQLSMEAILSDLDFLISTTNYWLFFLRSETLLPKLKDPFERAHLQPALVLSALAMASLIKSSEVERGSQGRERALALRNDAQASLEAACSTTQIDYQLAEAALIIALFESSSHPEHNTQRAAQSLQIADRIITTLSLQRLDEGDVDVPMFPPEEVPQVFTPGFDPVPERCRCISPSLPMSPGDHYATSFSFDPPWSGRDEVDNRKEECRRICWSALTLMSSYTSTCAVFHQDPVPLRLTDPSNYAILFPGEVFERAQSSGNQSPKQSVWALYCRSMLVWNAVNQRRDQGWSDDRRARFAVAAFHEIQLISDTVDMHQCNLDTALLYLSREYLYNTRMAIQYELRSLTAVPYGPPVFSRRQAEDWLYYQAQVVKRVQEAVKSLDDISGHILTRRPFQVQWFSTQVSLCLSLWDYDRSLYHALDLAKGFLIPLDALNILWPCPVQQARCDELRARLTQACHAARVHAPLLPHLSLPPKLQTLL